jgi:hypothetical protein
MPVVPASVYVPLPRARATSCELRRMAECTRCIGLVFDLCRTRRDRNRRPPTGDFRPVEQTNQTPRPAQAKGHGFNRWHCACLVVAALAIGLTLYIILDTQTKTKVPPDDAATAAPFPLVRPLMRTHAPPWLTRALAAEPGAELDTSLFPLSVLVDAGPANMFDILAEVDWTTHQPQLACMADANATSYIAVRAWNETNQTFPVSCNGTWEDVVASVGRDATANVYYLYTRSNASTVSVRATTNSTGSVLSIDMRYATRPANATEPRVAVHAHLDIPRARFELTTAGMHIGFCGYQLRYASGTTRITSSSDEVTICTPSVVACYNATTGTCTTATDDAYELVPLGRAFMHELNDTVYWADSRYPAYPTVTFLEALPDDTEFGPV